MPRAKAKADTVTPEAAPEETPADSTPKVTHMPKVSTKYLNLVKLQVHPKSVESRDYKEFHRFDSSTHTKIIPTAQNIINLLGNTGGGFRIEFVPTPSKGGWAEWIEFEKAGVEIVDFRCDTCGRALPINPLIIAEHFKVHPNRNRSPKRGGTFLVTFSKKTRPRPDEVDAFEDVDVSSLVG